MAKSILQDTRECYICRMLATAAGYYDELPSTGLHKHHTVYGKGNRPIAEHYGLWVYLCAKLHHEYGMAAVHNNRGIRMMLSKISQRAFEEKNPNLNFMQIFGISYVDPDEDFWPDVNEAMRSGSKFQQNVNETEKKRIKSAKNVNETEETVHEIEFIETELGELPF